MPGRVFPPGKIDTRDTNLYCQILGLKSQLLYFTVMVISEGDQISPSVTYYFLISANKYSIHGSDSVVPVLAKFKTKSKLDIVTKDEREVLDEVC